MGHKNINIYIYNIQFPFLSLLTFLVFIFSVCVSFSLCTHTHTQTHSVFSPSNAWVLFGAFTHFISRIHLDKNLSLENIYYTRTFELSLCLCYALMPNWMRDKKRKKKTVEWKHTLAHWEQRFEFFFEAFDNSVTYILFERWAQCAKSNESFCLTNVRTVMQWRLKSKVVWIASNDVYITVYQPNIYDRSTIAEKEYVSEWVGVFSMRKMNSNNPKR